HDLAIVNGGNALLRVSSQHTQLHWTEICRQAARIEDWKCVSKVSSQGIAVRGHQSLQALHVSRRNRPVLDRGESNHLSPEHKFLRLATKIRSDSADDMAHRVARLRRVTAEPETIEVNGQHVVLRGGLERVQEGRINVFGPRYVVQHRLVISTKV